MVIQNPDLTTIKPNWLGTPVDSHKRFVNLEFPFTTKFLDVLRWRFQNKPQHAEKLRDTYRPLRSTDKSFLKSTDDCIVWLGHASFYIRLGGRSMLIDPVFYDLPFISRFSQHAFSTSDFTQLDYLLISHDHRDHCQKRSIQEITINNPHVKILSGLRMEPLLRPWAAHRQVIEEAGWYQQFRTTPDVSIFFLPTRHWSKRSVMDTNKRLWGAFVIQSKDRTIYFSGDTGYGSHFKETAKLFPSIDVAIIGVGAYKPEWFMAPNHISPTDAVRASNDLGAKVFIPMHYGTFNLSDEPPGEPVRILKQLQDNGILQAKLMISGIGQCYNFQD